MRNALEMSKLQLLRLLLLLQPILASTGLLPGYLERHMNASADACLDFYEHSCGGWAEAHSSDDYSSQLEQLDHMYHGRLATLLEQQREAEAQPRLVQLLHASYASCRAQQGGFEASQFVRWLREWGGIDAASENSDWSRLLRLLKNYGLTALLQLENDLESTSDADADSELESESSLIGDAELWLLQLQPPWPAVPTDDAAAPTGLELLTRSRFRHLYRVLQPLGVPQNKLWQQIKQLEQQIWLLAHQVEQELQNLPVLLALPDVLLDDVELSRWLLPLPQATVAHWLPYLHRLSALLAAQPAPLLGRYLLLRLLHKLQLLPAPAFGRQQCAAQSRQMLTHAAVWLLQQQQPPQQQQQTEATMQQLFEQLRQQFELKLLVNRNRFGSSTQRFLLDKLRRMRLRVGVLPSGTADEQRQQLEAHYAHLQLNASDYYGNLLAMMRQTEQEAHSDLYLLQPDGFGSYASPFFLPASNLVLLPQSLLGAHLYRPGQAAVYTHSALGFLMAHELSHGFAPSDVRFDGRGREATAQQRQRLRSNGHFGNQTRCLRRRHGQMADEKFADINGLALAYDSYFTATPPRPPSEQRLFFLNFAQFFCRDDLQLEDSRLHGSNRQRVNDAVASSESFAHAFSCGRSMRKKHTCQLY